MPRNGPHNNNLQPIRLSDQAEKNAFVTKLRCVSTVIDFAMHYDEVEERNKKSAVEYFFVDFRPATLKKKLDDLLAATDDEDIEAVKEVDTDLDQLELS